MTRFSSYQKRLFVFLSVATFFEGYDFMALSQILPSLQSEMRLGDAELGLMTATISLGAIAAFGLVRLADRLGRRRILAITILGYATLTFLTALARGPLEFTAYQFTARVFLVAEWAVCIVLAAEEYPAARRGFVIGVIQGFNALGSITNAAVVPVLLTTPWGWRTVYLIGVVPLLLLAYARRNLRETGRFAQLEARRTAPRGKLLAIFRSPYRNRVLQLALIWGLTYICTNTAVLFWKQFAVTERGLSNTEVGAAIAIATVIALPFAFSVGKLLDAWGRKRAAILIYGVCAVFVVLAFQLHEFWQLTACLVAAVFSAVAILTLLNTLTTELFPTHMRADAFAWANTLLGRIGYVAGPLLVGVAAGPVGWGNAVSLTALAVVTALILILWLLPETKGLELEEAAAL
ncbi:MAG TPA: MFS transporter [Gemmatimonadales bacterium]